MPRTILQVSQLNAATRALLEANFNQVWVEGEISNLVTPNSGHLYFSLKDATAQVRAVMFRNYNLGLKFQPKNGARVVVAAQVSLYEARGDYQLLVEYMEPVGDGLLHAKFLQLKAKLEAEGLFAAKYKKPLPTMPQRVGVVTSPTGAAVRDIITVLKRRFPSVEIIIYPTQVQGVEAASQIARAIEIANKRKECDVLIVARGGGSLEDLWPFNEEVVARAIFVSTIPVVSAVGHEIDFTIADFVADVRAPTPSAAAEVVVPDIRSWCNAATNCYRRLVEIMVHKLQHSNWQLTNLQSRLRHPRFYLEQQAQRLDELEYRLQLVMQQQLTHWRHCLVKSSNALNIVSPLATLARGYAIVSKNEKIVYSSREVAIGDTICARLAEGKLSCVVEGV